MKYPNADLVRAHLLIGSAGATVSGADARPVATFEPQVDDGVLEVRGLGGDRPLVARFRVTVEELQLLDLPRVVTTDTRTRYDVAVESDGVGHTSVWMDLTPDEAALLARVGERIANASHDERLFTVEPVAERKVL